MDFLGEEYPSLHVFILENLKFYSKVEEYMVKCKELENQGIVSNDSVGKYSLYIHGYLLVWLD